MVSTIIGVIILVAVVAGMATLMYKTNRQIDFEDDVRSFMDSFELAQPQPIRSEIRDMRDIDVQALLKSTDHEAIVVTVLKAKEAYLLSLDVLEETKKEIAKVQRMRLIGEAEGETLSYLFSLERQAERRVGRELKALRNLIESVQNSGVDLEAVIDDTFIPYDEWAEEETVIDNQAENEANDSSVEHGEEVENSSANNTEVEDSSANNTEVENSSAEQERGEG